MVSRINAALWLLACVGGLVAACRKSDGPSSPPAPSQSLNSLAQPMVAAPSSSAAAASTPRSSGDEALNAQFAVLRKGGKNTVRFVAPSDAELTMFREWMRGAGEGARAGKNPVDKAPGGFVAQAAGDRGVWLVSERPDARRGAGAFALRIGDAVPLIVEAPHTFFDEGTLPIAMEVFDGHKARALLINTVHRNNAKRKGAHGEEASTKEGEGGSESDMAHASKTFYLGAHEALTLANPDAIAIQIHGFDDASAPGVHVILSAAKTGTNIKPIADSLGKVLEPERVKMYPEQIRTLGGTTNVQAKASGRMSRRFVHMELSGTLRHQLVADASLRGRFVEALVKPLIEVAK